MDFPSKNSETSLQIYTNNKTGSRLPMTKISDILCLALTVMTLFSLPATGTSYEEIDNISLS